MSIPDSHLCRRRDPAQVILAALADKVRGFGYRTVAKRCGLGEFPTEVRGWVKAFAAKATSIRLQMTAWAMHLDSSPTAIARVARPSATRSRRSGSLCVPPRSA
jgi:hypothetical protein